MHNEKLWNLESGRTKPKTIKIVYKLPPTLARRQHFEPIKSKEKKLNAPYNRLQFARPLHHVQIPKTRVTKEIFTYLKGFSWRVETKVGIWIENTSRKHVLL